MATKRFDLLTFSDEENYQNSSDSDNDNSEMVTVDAEVSLRRDKKTVSGDLSDRDTDGYQKVRKPGEGSIEIVRENTSLGSVYTDI